jgi:hypothetical protein
MSTESPEIVGAPPPPEARHPLHLPSKEWLAEAIDGRVALGLGLVWLVLTEVAVALEPATSHEMPVIGAMLALAMWSLVACMAVGLVMRRRWGLAGAVAASVFLTAESIACPTTGHHPFGAWWFGQMACVLALVAVSVYALMRAPRVDDVS